MLVLSTKSSGKVSLIISAHGSRANHSVKTEELERKSIITINTTWRESYTKSESTEAEDSPDLKKSKTVSVAKKLKDNSPKIQTKE